MRDLLEKINEILSGQGSRDSRQRTFQQILNSELPEPSGSRLRMSPGQDPDSIEVRNLLNDVKQQLGQKSSAHRAPSIGSNCGSLSDSGNPWTRKRSNE